MTDQSIEDLAITTIRTLSIDAVEKANSGHPGLPMGAAPMAYTLWSKCLKHNPANARWFNRDRFVLSAGHGSMLLYSLLHLSGYDLSLDDLKRFRQWGSKTPGHPEFGHTEGVEATTGPLGQGIANAVGMAMAERHLAARYNREEYPIVDHYTYVLCGDGDLMEGIAYEAASLAGHLGLGRLIVLYDSNDISLDGDLRYAFSENIQQRFEASGWEYLRVEDGNDTSEIEQAIRRAQKNTAQPTLIEVKTIIGYGSPNQGGTNAAHGSPLGKEEVKLTKEHYKWTFAEDFHVPEEVRAHFAELKKEGQKNEEEWKRLFAAYKEKYPRLASEFLACVKGELPDDWADDLPAFQAGEQLATRAASGKAIQHISRQIPNFWGGSADLASSNNTLIEDGGRFQADDYGGRNIWFGVREHAMGAAMNGIALHGGLRIYGGTFFVFSDYLRPAIRLAALQNLPVTYVFTHDSIAVGEDGPTHEPVEQLPSLRALPGLTVLRPADANETVAAWQYALSNTGGPTALVLTRQKLPVLKETENSFDRLSRGAYVLADADQGEAKLILLASGSEVSLVLQAQEKLADEGIPVRVVSMPSWELFENQDQAYKDAVLPPQLKKRLAVEMARPFGWERYIGSEGAVLGIDKFGASAPGHQVVEAYGFTVENVVSKAKQLLSD